MIEGRLLCQRLGIHSGRRISCAGLQLVRSRPASLAHAQQPGRKSTLPSKASTQKKRLIGFLSLPGNDSNQKLYTTDRITISRKVKVSSFNLDLSFTRVALARCLMPDIKRKPFKRFQLSCEEPTRRAKASARMRILLRLNQYAPTSELDHKWPS
jgi:hypothetical protein